MDTLVVYIVENQYYALDIEQVKRIIPAQKLTPINDDLQYIEGVISYEGDILKVVDFRRLIDIESYGDKLRKLFPDLKNQHKAWLSALEDVVHKDVPFSKTTDPHACNLGKWIDKLHPEDPEVMKVINTLDTHHKALHKSAISVIDLYSKNKKDAIEWVDSNVQEIYKNTISSLEEISKMSDMIAISEQKTLILENDEGESFGLNVDSIDNILHINENDIQFIKSNPGEKIVKIKGILENNNRLITILENFNIKVA